MGTRKKNSHAHPKKRGGEWANTEEEEEGVFISSGKRKKKEALLSLNSIPFSLYLALQLFCNFSLPALPLVLQRTIGDRGLIKRRRQIRVYFLRKLDGFPC